VHVDWTGSDPQVPGSVNFFLNREMFKMFTGVFLIMAFAPDLVFNDGYYDVIHCTIPDGSVLRPDFPAPLGNRLSLMARQFDVVGGVFSKALEHFAVTGSYGTSPNFVYSGVKESGEAFQTMEILYGGIPAIPGKDGLDGHSWWPEFLAVPAEYMETYYPMIVDEYSARRDSCGAGEFRGGCGIKKVYRFLSDGRITYQDDRALTFPYGVAGGKPGAASGKTLIRKDGEEIELPSKVRDVPVYAGDRLVFETAGAGGVGDPLERDPEAVAKDVRWNLVGPEAAASGYGVVVGEDGAVDAGATESKREEMKTGRGDQPGFDHGNLPALEEQRRMVADTRRRFNEWLSGELGAARKNDHG
jgi:N-methylhydantoinase B